MAKRRKTPELVAEAIRLRQSGLSLAKISSAIGVSMTAVNAWTRGHAPKRRKSKGIETDSPCWAAISSHQSDSHNYPGHEERLAAHRKRILAWLREHPEETFGTALGKSAAEG